MNYETMDFSILRGIEGLSEQLLENHFALYQGYVTNTNKILEKTASLLMEDKSGEPEYAELKRRLGWEYNGMRLHEYYFGNMKKGGAVLEKDSALYKKIELDFGSFENWEKDFRATGSMRGIGWAALYYDFKSDKLINFWINEHNSNHLAGEPLILIMDVFEHAFMIDYGVKKADYIDAFFKVIDWGVVGERFGKVLK